ncbi:TylF/MycF family methyltransferase [Dactylosporangium fulvum]|uniref:TylF/MycF family methyltransferase n=1 Tax=Dactylosporangium fulvum TaxID=53359 RepID=A0ABY5W9Q2_9ACTN|nr:TylF/MycF family methyltransferase [Dactylosporangium fulvum]UWP86120.1 TylF/MycF family methyltransferase [Dactylosporangium fulvum]
MATGETGLYLDLLKKTLTNMIYGDTPQPTFFAANQGYDEVKRANGLDWPSVAHTMVGRKRLDNLQHCVEAVLDDGVAGDFIEAGVWRGGASILVRGVLKARGVTDRDVWLADSFQGMPVVESDGHPVDHQMGLHRANNVLAVDLDTVKANFARYDLLDERVRFLPGWFRDTLPDAPVEKLAVLRLDGDLHESVMDGLVHLYPKLCVGGFVIIDDYVHGPCAEAVHEYRDRHGITDPIEDIDGVGAFWRRTG